MKITCEKCSTKYVIPDESVGINGKKVRCARCKNLWFIFPEEELAFSKSTELVSAPPIMKKNNTHALYICLISILVSLSIILSSLIYKNNIIDIFPFTENLYNKIGFYDTRDIIISNPAIWKISSRDTKKLLVRAEIYNKSNITKTIPKIRIRIYDVNNQKIFEHIMAGNNKFLSPGEFFPLESNIKNINMHSSNIIIDIGNNLELFLR